MTGRYIALSRSVLSASRLTTLAGSTVYSRVCIGIGIPSPVNAISTGGSSYCPADVKMPTYLVSHSLPACSEPVRPWSPVALQSRSGPYNKQGRDAVSPPRTTVLETLPNF
ncbi:hypothetical protein F4825DRAFT_343804 [Nemania diffusa]|nr:hypothetical protein F4825DRAFT_343804 [Nemania diffusa]